MKKVLGRGIESLIPEKTENEIKEIKINLIKPNKYQMRVNFNEQKINEMAESMKENGLIQPILVTKMGNKYMVVAGERRLRAAEKAGLKSIACLEKEMNNENFLTLSLIENIQRENLSPLEEAAAFDKMIKEFSMTQQEIAEKVGKSRSVVANTLRILSLPEDIINLIDGELITAGHARALLAVNDIEKRRQLAKKIVREKLTVREAEKLANIVSGKSIKRRKKIKTKDLDPEIKKMEEIFEKKLGTKVNVKIIKSKNKKKIGSNVKGTIEIEFYCMEDFERISDVICRK